MTFESHNPLRRQYLCLPTTRRRMRRGKAEEIKTNYNLNWYPLLNNGYQFQRHNLNRNKINYCWLETTQLQVVEMD